MTSGSPRSHFGPRRAERRLATWAAAASASMVLSFVALALFAGAVLVAAGEYQVLARGVFGWGVAWFAGYVVSIYLLTTLAGQRRRRRLGSWVLAIAFNGGLVAYFMLGLDWGPVALVLLLGETAAAVLSVAGLVLAARASA